MKLIKKLLGFNSVYSWMKWLRIAGLVATLLSTIYICNAYSIVGSSGFTIFIYIIVFTIMFVICMGITLGIGAVAGIIFGSKRQFESLRASSVSGDDEAVELETLRIKAQTGTFTMKAFATLGIIGAIYIIFGNYNNWLVVYLIIVVPIFIKLWAAVNPARKEYAASFQDKVVKTALESVLENMDYRPDGCIDESIVKASQLFEFDTIKGNDYISADYKGIHFIRSDVYLHTSEDKKYKTDDGEWRTHTVYHSVFEGQFMVFDYDAVSDEPVFIFDKRTHRLVGDITSTELDAFNRRFIIKSNDAPAAFRILTPPVLEGITLASNKLKGPVSMSFLNDKVYIAISGEDAFQARTDGDTTLVEQSNRVREELQTILDMVVNMYIKP